LPKKLIIILYSGRVSPEFNDKCLNQVESYNTSYVKYVLMTGWWSSWFTCNICTLPQPEQENDQHPSVGLWWVSFWYRTPVQAGWQPFTPPMSRHSYPVLSVTHTRQLTAAHMMTTYTPYRLGVAHHARMNSPRTHTATHGHTRTDGRTDGRTIAHDTTTATTVRIPTDMSRRRRRRLSRWQLGARAGRRAAGLWESPLRWPATGSDVRRLKGAFVPGPGPFMNDIWLTRAIRARFPGPYSFPPYWKRVIYLHFFSLKLHS